MNILYSLFYFFFETSVSFKLFFLPVYWKQLGLSASQIGSLRVVWGLAYIAGSIIIGHAADRWRLRKALLLLCVLSSMATPLLGMIPQRTHDVCIVTVVNATKTLDAVSKSQTRSLQPSWNQEHQKTSHSLPNSAPSVQTDTEKVHPVMQSGGIETHNQYWREETSQNFPQNKEAAFSSSLAHYTDKTPTRKVYTLEKNPKDLEFIFWSTLCILAVGEFLSSPAYNLVNSAILDHLGENKRAFSRIRLWGPIGQFISTPVTTALVTHFHYYLCGEYQDDLSVVFIVIALVVVVSFALTTTFEVRPKKTQDNTAAAGEEEAMTLGGLLYQYQNVVYLCLTLYIGCCDGVILTFSLWYMKNQDTKTATTVFGFTRMVSSFVSAVLLWFVEPAVTAVGYTGVMAFCFLLFAGWFVGVSFMANLWMMLLFETVGYTAYILSFTTIVSYYGEVTPSHLIDTVQG